MLAVPDLPTSGCPAQGPVRCTCHEFHVVLRNPESTSAAGPALTIPAHMCRLTISLQGDVRIRTTTGETADGEELCLSPGSCLLQYAPAAGACTRCACGHRVQLLEISCPADSLHQLVGDTPLGRELEQAMSGRHALHVLRSMSPAARLALKAVHETLTSSCTGAGALTISRALEMLWHCTHCDGRENEPRITRQTMEALGTARRILEENLETPPDLETLAGLVGLSLSRLKLLFPRVYGMPPFALLRQLRMERARHLLRVEKRSVTDVALEVGYANISHFSKIFAEHYGLRPSQARRGLDPQTGAGPRRASSGNARP